MKMDAIIPPSPGK